MSSLACLTSYTQVFSASVLSQQINFLFQIYINWMNFIVNLMLPLGALLFMNLSIYKGLQKLHGHLGSSTSDNKERKKSSVIDVGTSLLNNSEEEEEKERDARFARASILMVVAFGLCHTPRLISNTVEMFIDTKDLPDVSITHFVSRNTYIL